MSQKKTDRSKAKTLFNYTYTTLKNKILPRGEATCHTRGLLNGSDAKEAINNLIEKIGTHTVTESVICYQSTLNTLLIAINKFAKEKSLSQYVIDYKYDEISNKEAFIKICKKCLYNSYNISNELWEQGDYTNYYSNPQSFIAATSSRRAQSEPFDSVLKSTTDELQESNEVVMDNENKNPIDIKDAYRFRKEFRIGILLLKLRFGIFTIKDKVLTLKELMTEEEYNKTFNYGQYDFKEIRFAFFFKNNLPFSCMAGLGYLCGYYSHLHKMSDSTDPTRYNSNYKEDTLKSLICFPNSLISNADLFMSSLDEICNLSDESICENVLRLLNPNIYDQDDEEKLQATIRLIVENDVFNYSSLTEAKVYLENLRKSSRIVGNNLIVISCDWLIEKIENGELDEKYYNLRKKYNIWASNSLWDDTDYFESICMDLIESITTNNKLRSGAIQEAKQLLATIKNFAKEHDIQIYERVYFEFNIASDAEYKMLRKQIVGN